MADFCKQCSINIFGEDYGDLASITEQKEWEEGRAVCTICEGCGPIQLDPQGNCVSTDCMCKGQVGHGMPWFTALVGAKE